ncbi:hypothetical protein DU504_02635 [Haloplanus salinus]|jgi:hypothetical protein|uniref:Uncharacterized protein n=1 Tax=Haloplanus salinus TaxID=1126245 RepID=A0A368N7X7_9EURY|nr:hypothetical protein [Haloplanus salinus]RCU46296.1 hypothetical protein DU504_02635 [Haloplanus salinus]
MATRERHAVGTTLPGVVPFDPPALTRLSWELGSRVIDDEASARVGRWECVGSSWSLSVFRVTSETVVVRVRTPIGRQRFYGAAWMDLESDLSKLDAAPSWERSR